MRPIVLYNHAKKWEDPWDRFLENNKTLNKGTLNSHLIVNCAGLIFFQKSNLAQTMRPIVLYNHAKNWEDPRNRFREKAKNLKKRTLVIYNPG